MFYVSMSCTNKNVKVVEEINDKKINNQSKFLIYATAMRIN
jgi:hypothetical protein